MKRNPLQKLLLVFVLIAGFVSCRKDDFDEPPLGGEDPAMVANMTIDSLKKMYQDTIIFDNAIIKIQNDWIISAVVIADDKSGNLYKSIIVDDGTAGISIRIDQSDYNTDYPVGRRIFIKLKNLAMGDYSNMIQLGSYVDATSQPASVEPIPSSLIRSYFFPGKWGIPVVPHNVSIAELNANNNKWQNRLIRLDGVEFEPADTAQTWADAVNLFSEDRMLVNCDGDKIIVRTSGYSNFASLNTPTGNGSLVAVFTVYNTTEQLVLRDLNDVQMDTARCNGSGGGPVTPINIIDARNLYPGTTTAPSGTGIYGVVISDRANNNLNGRNVYIQDNTGGIVVRFAANHTFNLGDSVEVKIGGRLFNEFNGLLQIDNVPNANATLLGTGTVTPRIATIADILANMNGASDSWESTLVTIVDATITGGATYSGSKQVNDGTGTMTMFTATGATFSGSTIPSGPVTLTAILSEYSFFTPPNTGEQLLLRNLSDVQP